MIHYSGICGCVCVCSFILLFISRYAVNKPDHLCPKLNEFTIYVIIKIKCQKPPVKYFNTSSKNTVGENEKVQRELSVKKVTLYCIFASHHVES